MPKRSLILTAAIALTLALGLSLASQAGAAKVKLTTAKAKPVKLIGTSEYLYASDARVWFECRRGTKPLIVGWSGPNAPVAIIYSHVYNSDGQMALAVRKPVRSGSFKSFAICASGPIAAKAKQAKGTVKCSAKQIAIGVPIDAGPYYKGDVFSKPVGTRGRTNNEGGYGGAKVICVSKKAFKRVNLSKSTAAFRPGARTATVTATCKGGRVPISWGFEAPAMKGNTWATDTASVVTPLIGKSVKRGKAGWSLTFFTPDGKGATEAAKVTLHLTCAVPA